MTRVMGLIVAMMGLTAPAATAGPGDEAPATPPAVPELPPDGARSELGVELATGGIDGIESSVTQVTLEGQYVAWRGFGAYGRHAISWFDDRQAVSNVEIGGLFRATLTPRAAIAVRIGTTLPTAPSYRDPSAQANAVGFRLRRPADQWLSVSDTALLRLSLSPSYSHGAAFARADVGLDVVFENLNTDVENTEYHLAVAAGVRSGYAAAWISLQSASALELNRHETDDALTFGAVYERGIVALQIGLTFPFRTGDTDNGFNDARTFAIGVRARL